MYNLCVLLICIIFCILQTYYLCPRSLNWPEYVENHILGTKLYVMNEALAGVPAARAHLTK